MVVDATHREGFVVIAAHHTIGPVAAALAIMVLGATTRPTTPRAHIEFGFTRPPTVDQPGRWRRLLRIGAVLVGATMTGLLVGPSVVGIAAGGAFVVHKVGPLRADRQRRVEIERALPDAIDLLVLSVRAGLTPFQAVCELARSDARIVASAFAEVVRRTERGQSFADALVALPERLGDLASAVADTIATSDRHGLALGPALDQLTAETRATRRRLDQADARKLPVRLSFPLVTCTLPSFVLLAIAPAVIAALSSLGEPAW
jgi:tight adherence protein C